MFVVCMSPFVGRAVRRSDMVKFHKRGGRRRGGYQECAKGMRSPLEVLLATEAASRGVEVKARIQVFPIHLSPESH